MIRLSELIISILFLVTGGIMIWSSMPLSAQSLAYDLQGKILLQVEENGEAWYVYPGSLERYYLGRPADAFEIMRNLGLGISNENLEKIPVDTEPFYFFMHDRDLQERLSGMILLQVEENGEAWYVYPEDMKRYFLGRPADAFDLMRDLGLGISNENLLSIPISIDSKLPDYNNGNGLSTTLDPKLYDGKDTRRQTLLNNANAERAAVGSPALQLVKELSAAAQAQVDDMEAKDYFDFTSPTGKTISDWVGEQGYNAHLLAENILQTNQGTSNLVLLWKNEGGISYQNVIDSQYNDIGIGIGSYQGLQVFTVLFAYSLRDFFNDNTAGLNDLAAVRNEMLASVNFERSQAGLRPLDIDPLLNQAAQAHTDDMLNRSYYAHESPEGQTAYDRIIAAGYDPVIIAENIAKGQFSVEQVMEGWMDSAGHRANILGEDYTEIGFGLSYGKNQNGYEILWSQNFAAPLE